MEIKFIFNIKSHIIYEYYTAINFHSYYRPVMTKAYMFIPSRLNRRPV